MVSLHDVYTLIDRLGELGCPVERQAPECLPTRAEIERASVDLGVGFPAEFYEYHQSVGTLFIVPPPSVRPKDISDLEWDLEGLLVYGFEGGDDDRPDLCGVAMEINSYFKPHMKLVPFLDRPWASIEGAAPMSCIAEDGSIVSFLRDSSEIVPIGETYVEHFVTKLRELEQLATGGS